MHIFHFLAPVYCTSIGIRLTGSHRRRKHRGILFCFFNLPHLPPVMFAFKKQGDKGCVLTLSFRTEKQRAVLVTRARRVNNFRQNCCFLTNQTRRNEQAQMALHHARRTTFISIQSEPDRVIQRNRPQRLPHHSFDAGEEL